MKKFRRIEITAFRRRITIASGVAESADPQPNEDVCISHADSSETIEFESAEGQRILIEAVRLLDEKLSNQARKVL